MQITNHRQNPQPQRGPRCPGISINANHQENETMKIELTTEQADTLLTAILRAASAARAEARSNDKTAAHLETIPDTAELVTQFKGFAAEQHSHAAKFDALSRIVAIALHNAAE